MKTRINEDDNENISSSETSSDSSSNDTLDLSDTEDDKNSDDTDEKDEDAIDMNGFIILKPEYLDKESQLQERLEEEGWKIVGNQEKKLTKEEAEELFSRKKNEPYFDDAVEYMISDKSKCFMVWKEDASDPIAEINTIVEKLRSEWTDDEIKNAIQSSESFDDMEKELSVYLKKQEEKKEPEENSENSENSESDDSGDDNFMFGGNDSESDSNQEPDSESD